MCFFCVWAISASTQAADVITEPAPHLDDANLRSVQMLRQRIGWAVGDRGAVWRTDDGGQNWQPIACPVDAQLTSVCFLTDRVGWIAGGSTAPYTRLGTGVVLFTQDGGKSWKGLATGRLPRLSFVRFFGMSEGVVVGEGTADHPGGVFVTEDGGENWTPVAADRRATWTSAAFTTPRSGVVAGAREQAALVGNGRVILPRTRLDGLRGFHACCLDLNDTGWLVGDGGQILRTVNGGVVWQPPEGPLPERISEAIDFRAVAQQGERAWFAGSPGSVIWHTADNGRSWLRQWTGQTVPINSLSFSSETHGLAAGDLGTILCTTDGGATWSPVRGAQRHLALLSIHARSDRTPLHLLVKESGELGYRAGTLLPVRHDTAPGIDAALSQQPQLREAIALAGASCGEIDWPFPIEAPELDRHTDRLVADWNARAEGRLAEVFVGRLVRHIRTWKPYVVVVDLPSSEDAATTLLNDAVVRAVEQAADPTRCIAHQQLAGLNAWQVRKIYRRLPPGSVGSTQIDLHQFLPQRGVSVQSAAAPAFALLGALPKQTARQEAYRLTDIFDENGRRGDVLAASSGHDFFLGVPLLPGSAARRKLPPLVDAESVAQQKLIEKQRNFQAYAERMLDDPRHASQVIAELRNITQGMSNPVAAFQLLQLARDYRERAQWDLAEATLVELVEKYPDEPVTLDAMQWLMQYWSSTEAAWLRARRTTSAERQQLQADLSSIPQRIQRAAYLAAVDPGQRDAAALEEELGPDPVQFATFAGQVQVGEDAAWRNAAVQNWQEQALRMASLLRRKSPAMYRTPQVQFTLASLLRQRGSHKLADRLVRRFEMVEGGGSWQQSAAAELWLLNPIQLPPRPLTLCRRTVERPKLDGVLGDACWLAANEIRLQTVDKRGSREIPDDPARHSFVLLSYDSQFLYLAASLPRIPGREVATMQTAGRKHDADLIGRDRISLMLDIDRDYGTWYALHVDERGCTAESCWDDASWNPRWYVATSSDESTWRIEAAIPLEELSPMTPYKDVVWMLGVTRTVPAIGYQSWTGAAADHPAPEVFGLLKFD